MLPAWHVGVGTEMCGHSGIGPPQCQAAPRSTPLWPARRTNHPDAHPIDRYGGTQTIADNASGLVSPSTFDYLGLRGLQGADAGSAVLGPGERVGPGAFTSGARDAGEIGESAA